MREHTTTRLRLALLATGVFAGLTPRLSRAQAETSSVTTTASVAEARGDDTRARLEALEHEVRALEGLVLAIGDDGSSGPDVRVYGFFETGVQRTWTQEGGLLHGLQQSPGLSFVLGNLHLYLDVEASPNWRALVEARLTTNHGALASVNGGGLTLLDTNERAVNEPGIGVGTAQLTTSIVLERAQIEWRYSDLLGARLGLWLTPWGIWNVDHGSPTLIPLIKPYFVSFQVFPSHQLGLSLFGQLDLDGWLLEYNLAVSNGRITGPGTLRGVSWPSFDITDDKMFSGRLVVARPSAQNLRFGLSAHWGRTAQDSRQVLQIDPVRLRPEIGVVLEEWGFGADLSWDPWILVLRGEFIYGRFSYPDERPLSTLHPLDYEPDSVQLGGYLLVSAPFELGRFGLEPYVYNEMLYMSAALAPLEMFGMASFGVNLRFTPSVMLKVQYGWQYFLGDGPSGIYYDPSERVHLLSSRFVVSF